MRRFPAIGRFFVRSRRSAILASILVIWWVGAVPGKAQQAGHQPRYDPQQTERAFKPLEADWDRATKPPVQIRSPPKAAVRGDTKPLFVLRAVSIEGASVIPGALITGAYG